MKKVAITVYEEDWKSVRKAALDAGVSAGKYLMDLHQNNLGYQDSVKPANPRKYDSHKPVVGDQDVANISSPTMASPEDLPDVLEKPDPLQKAKTDLEKITGKPFLPNPKLKDKKKK